MPGPVEQFAQLVSGYPSPSEELLRHGSYPVRNADGSWTDPITPIKPILEGYFARSWALTEQNDVFFNGFPGYGLTCEDDYPRVLSKISRVGGAFVGVGALLGLTFAATQRASHAFITDNNASIPHSIIPCLGGLYCMAPTRAQFVSLVMGNPLEPGREMQFTQMSGRNLVYEILDVKHDAGFADRIIAGLGLAIGEQARSGEAQTIVNIFFNWMWKSQWDLLKMDGIDENGFGGALSSEEAYQRERRLFLEGRVTGIAVDLTSESTQVVFDAIKALRERLGVVYLSNVEGWLSKNDIAGISTFYDNLLFMSALGHPVAISSLSILNPMVFDLLGYLSRAYPFDLPPQDAAGYWADFLSLRHSIIVYMEKAKITGATPKQLLDRVLFGAADLMKTLLEDTNRLFRGSPMNWDIFHQGMMEKSETYRGLPDEVKQMFLLNMMDLGIVLTPYPIVYRNNELMIPDRKKSNGGSGNQGGAGGGTVSGIFTPNETTSGSSAAALGYGNRQAIVRHTAVSPTALRRIPAQQRFVRTPVAVSAGLPLRAIAR